MKPILRRLLRSRKEKHETKVYTVIVNIWTNIYKTNNHLSLQTIKHKKTTLCGVAQPGPSFGHAQKCGEVKPVHGNLV